MRCEVCVVLACPHSCPQLPSPASEQMLWHSAALTAETG